MRAIDVIVSAVRTMGFMETVAMVALGWCGLSALVAGGLSVVARVAKKAEHADRKRRSEVVPDSLAGLVEADDLPSPVGRRSQ